VYLRDWKKPKATLETARKFFAEMERQGFMQEAKACPSASQQCMNME
jgi:hypothetical protein